MSAPNITYVNSDVLDSVERQLDSVLASTHASAILLIDSSGVCVSCVGHPPLHPSQMGAVAAGICSAMGCMIRASRIEDFSVRVADIGLNLQFHHVDMRLFLCAFYSDSQLESGVRKALKEVALQARDSLTEDQTLDRRIDSLDFIEEKLNELFEQ